MGFRRLAISALIVAAAWLAPSVAAAQPDTRGAQADRLFQEGRELMAAGRLEEACARFAASEAVDPNAATLLNLANCYEQGGRITWAWVTYRAAGTLARRQGRQDRLETATARAQALEQGHARVRIIVTEPTPVPRVELDGTPLEADALGVLVPLQPGSHTVLVTAAGKQAWSSRFDVQHQGEVDVRVPALVDASTPPSPSPSPPPARVVPPPHSPKEATWFSTQRTVGLVTLGVGVASAGVAAVLGGIVVGMTDDIDAKCPEANACYAEGIEQNEDAHGLADASTALFVVGGALATVGLVITLTGKDEEVSARVTPRRVALGLAW